MMIVFENVEYVDTVDGVRICRQFDNVDDSNCDKLEIIYHSFNLNMVLRDASASKSKE